MNKINANYLKLIAKLYINDARLNESKNNIYWITIINELIAEEESEKIFSYFYKIWA